MQKIKTLFILNMDKTVKTCKKYANICTVCAIQNETSICGRAIKTIQEQNDIEVVLALKGAQNSSVEKGDPQRFRV